MSFKSDSMTFGDLCCKKCSFFFAGAPQHFVVQNSLQNKQNFTNLDFRIWTKSYLYEVYFTIVKQRIVFEQLLVLFYRYIYYQLRGHRVSKREWATFLRLFLYPKVSDQTHLENFCILFYIQC